jgi:hypothetical protein
MVSNLGVEPSPAQKLYFVMVLQPIWRGQLDQLLNAQRVYRYHLLAAHCLRVGVGPGGDPLRLVEFCRKWQLPLTAPLVGPAALLRKIGKLAGGWPSAAAVFDPMGAINLGVKVIANMGPLIGKLQIRNAVLVALDESVVSVRDQCQVLSILESSETTQLLMTKLTSSKMRLESVWRATQDLAVKMEDARKQLGLPEA